MKLTDIQQRFHQELDAIYGKAEVESFFFILADFYDNLKRIDLSLNPEFELTYQNKALYLQAMEALKDSKPIQYITGETHFFGLKFLVDERVLIPRPETQELVDWILDENKAKALNSEGLKILDIGTGSGCIAVCLAKELAGSILTAIDVSEKALDCAMKNARLNEVEVEFRIFDVLKESHRFLDEDDHFDIIVSNPPYVRQSEASAMRSNVLEHEPHLALFVEDEDALKFYKHISLFAKNNLKDQGLLFFEINEYLGEELQALLESFEFTNIMIKNDLFGKPRMVKAQKKQ